MHPPKISEGIMHTFVQCNASTSFVGQGILHGAENVSGTWEGKCHGAEFA
jgi:hypothetical protein